MTKVWTDLAVEPTLDEILDDPIVHLLMQRDRTGVNQVRSLVDLVRNRLGLGEEIALAPESPGRPDSAPAAVASRAA